MVTVRELAADLYGSLFKYRPERRDLEEMDHAFRVNHKLTGDGMDLPEYDRLRLYTKLKEPESAAATEVILSKVMEALEEEDLSAIEDAKEAGEAYQKALDRMQALQEFLEEHPEKGDEKVSSTVEGEGTGIRATRIVQLPLKDNLKEAQKDLEEANESLQTAVRDMKPLLDIPALRPALRAGMEEAAEQLEAFQQFCLSWGTEAGELQRLPAEEKMALMKRILESKKLRKLATLVGRLKRMALSKRSTRVTLVPEEVVDVTQGSDLDRILPAELALLGDPDREVLFFEKFLGRKLLEYELRGKEKMAKGPIICCIDNSGSMRGDRELWSKAVALALAEIARKDKRRFRVIHFGSDFDDLKVFDIKPKEKGKERLQKMLDIATYFLGGGTDFEKPLAKSVQIIRRAKQDTDYKKADIVFITDGGARLSPEFQENFLSDKKDLEFRLFSIIILGIEETLEDVSDETHHLVDLVKQGDGVASKIFEGV